MNVSCPLCHSALALEDINVSTDVALCRRCAKAFSFAEIAAIPRQSVNLLDPPPGSWYTQEVEGFRCGATTRSWMALFYIPFTCIWSGFSLTGIYGTQLMNETVDLHSSLLGIPFLIGTCFLIVLCAMNTVGKVEITQRGNQLSVFTGIGSLGWTRTAPFAEIAMVREEARSRTWNSNGGGTLIVLEGPTNLAFGSLLNGSRRYFLLAVLRQQLLHAVSLR